jgi:phospholipid transport system substrate-binding protein
MHSLLATPLRILIVGLALLVPPAASAQDAQGARQFLQSLADEALAVLNDPSVDDAEARNKAKELLSEGFDINTIGRFVIGRYWNVATPDQQREYLDLFQRMVLETYTSRFDEYAGSTFQVGDARPASETDVFVTSTLNRPGAPPLRIDWRIRDRDEGFQIIDVSVEGVSMAVTQRNEFASVIQRNGGKFDALLTALRSRVG